MEYPGHVDRNEQTSSGIERMRYHAGWVLEEPDLSVWLWEPTDVKPNWSCCWQDEADNGSYETGETALAAMAQAFATFTDKGWAGRITSAFMGEVVNADTEVVR